MADTRRVTAVIPWRLGFTSVAPTQSTPGRQICQTERRKFSFKLTPHGREVFLRELDPERVYQITFEGVCRYAIDIGWIFTSYERKSADALYHADLWGDFREAHHWLTLDNITIRHLIESAAPEAMPREDRELHRYSFRIEGSSRKLALRFSITSKKSVHKLKGSLRVTVELLPEGTPSPLAARQAMQAAEETARLKSGAEQKRVKEAARLEREAQQKRATLKNRLAQIRESLDRKIAEERAKHAKEVAAVAALEAKLEPLKFQAHWDSHLLDPTFQEAFVKRESGNILKTLKTDWQCGYAQFMRNVPLRKLAEENAPEVIQWLEARVKIVQLAERLAVAPLPESIEELKPTVEDARALVLSKHEDHLDEQIALMQLKGQKLAKLNEAANALPIDEDEKQRLSQQVSESIFEEGEEHDHGKNGHTL